MTGEGLPTNGQDFHVARQLSNAPQERITPREVRLQHLRNLEEAGIDAYPAQPPVITHRNLDVNDRFDQLEGEQVGVVGRIMAIRRHGRRVFYDIEDQEDRLQVSLTKKGEDDSRFDLIERNYDTADFVSVNGSVFKTRTGQVTIDVQEMTMLAKAIAPPPTERFGITDPEVGRRQRYLELMSNPEARERFRMRARMVQLMREEFLSRGFLEVETPIVDNVYGGATAKPFKTRMNALDEEMYLRIANELYLKKIVVGNMGPVFEFSRDFRNEGMDRTHNPEFTQVELYKPYSDYNGMMEMAETMFEKIAVQMHGTTQVRFQDHVIDFKAPWRRLTIYDGLEQAYGFDPRTITDEDLARIVVPLQEKGINLNKYPKRGDKLLLLFEEYFDDNKLIQPTFVMDFPAETSPLAKRHRGDTGLAERFECYIGGFEVMNSYTELNDPRDQRVRLEEEVSRKEGGDEEPMPTDEDFLVAMEHGMPPMGGIGISIDRNAMILTNTPHIRDIIFFPPVKRGSNPGR